MRGGCAWRCAGAEDAVAALTAAELAGDALARRRSSREIPTAARRVNDREVGIGIVGYGTMGKAHSYAYTAAPLIRSLRWRPRLRVISGRNARRSSGPRDLRRRARHAPTGAR